MELNEQKNSWHSSIFPFPTELSRSCNIWLTVTSTNFKNIRQEWQWIMKAVKWSIQDLRKGIILAVTWRDWKTVRNFTQNNWSLCQDMNREKYKSETSSACTLCSSQYWMLWLNYKHNKWSPYFVNKFCEYGNAHRYCLTLYSSYILLSLCRDPLTFTFWSNDILSRPEF
jgi:hypothetical protein